MQNTLKTSGPHIISGNWTLQRAIVLGHLNNVVINQLKLVNDIVHSNELKQSYDIKSAKTFTNAEIENLCADYLSVINKVPIALWILDAVYLYENYTIEGTTIIDSFNVYNSIVVFGKVNNVTFNNHNLLLKNAHQHISGSMRIISYLPKEKRFLTNNVENLYTDHINKKHISTFINNLLSTNLNTELKSHLIFNQTVKVENYKGPEGLLTLNQWNERNIDESVQLTGDKRQETYATLIELKKFLNDVAEGNKTLIFVVSI